MTAYEALVQVAREALREAGAGLNSTYEEDARTVLAATMPLAADALCIDWTPPSGDRQAASVLNAIADVFTDEDDWQPLSTRYRLASAVVESLVHHGYRIVEMPARTDEVRDA